MDKKTKDACSEISEILWILGDSYTEKLPKDLINYIEQHKNVEYIPTYSYEDSIDELDLKEETIAILTFLYLSYWCDSPEEKNEILKKLNDSEKNILEQKINTLNINELFPKKEAKNISNVDIQKQNISNPENQLILIKKESFLRKIINKIKKILS